ncbi:PREDICTED: uncharacterized protein LOC107065317 [Polistes dominula]|uniref:Uncharacterized protein LOC107065317 n=1 Tax=Polistes dominula TaxID=743375 RepID=A0ABM1I2F3_POLDO|nr:PREDICTED: uncharacterized protein LOC107065317 [Polistes dominula]
MDLHEKYMEFPTVSVTIIEIFETKFKDDPFKYLHNVVQLYNNLIKNPVDTKSLQFFNQILCYIYQLKFDHNNKCKFERFNDISIQNVDKIFIHEDQCYTASDISIIYDILLLQMVLYCDIKSIKVKLEQFRNSREFYLNDTNMTELYTKVLECFLDSLNLYCYLFNKDKCNEYKEFVPLFLDDVKFVLKTKDNLQWKSLGSILIKLYNMFDQNNILFLIWDLFLNELKNLPDLLIALNTIVNHDFQLEQDSLRDLYINLYCEDKFWIKIKEGLDSDVKQHKKWALHVLKKVMDFMGDMSKLENLYVTKSVLVPFICDNCSESTKKRNRHKFVLILEALQEVQAHLILPALSHLPYLIMNKRVCKNCLDITWLSSIFKRILKHDNKSLVKQGILIICDFDEIMCDDKFLEFFVNVLNNTFLYEKESNEDKSKVVERLIQLFNDLTESFDSILKKFLHHIISIDWGPVAIFYITYVLSNVFEMNQSRIKLEENDLVAIKSLSKCLRKHSIVLRAASQINIIKMISFSDIMINDLMILSQILYNFTIDEVLKKDSDTWKIIVNWLPKVIKNTSASTYICYSLNQYIVDDKTFYNDIKILVLMICLLHDAKLVFHTQTCVAFLNLKHLFEVLIRSDQRPYSNSQVNVRILILMSYLLNENRNIITQMLSNYGNIALTLVIKYVKKLPNILFEELDEFLNMITTFLNNRDLIILCKETMSMHACNLKMLVANIFDAKSIEYLSLIHVVLLCQNLNIVSCSKDMYEFCIKEMNNFELVVPFEKGSCNINNVKGTIMSRYYVLMTKLMHNYLLQFQSNTWKIDWYQIITKLLDLEGMNIISSIAPLLQAIIENDEIISEEKVTYFKSTIELCWKITFNHKKFNNFSQTVKSLLTVIINPKYLNIPDIETITNQFLDQLIEEGDNMPNLKRILLNRMESLNINHTIFNKINVPTLLLACLLHGYTIRRDKKIENQIYLSIEKDFQELYKLHSMNIDYNIDATVKAHAVILLHKIISKNPEFALIFWQFVNEELKKYIDKRYFKDSYIHRVKHRLMQILLLLEPVLNKESIISVQELICNLMLIESNQHSIRLMQEWLLIRIFVKYTDLHNKLWEFFEEIISKRPGCASSIASVIYHVSLFFFGQAQCDFLTRAMPYIAHCCLGQNFNVRLCNQVILVKLYELSKSSNFDNIVSEYSGIYNATVKHLQEGKSMKDLEKCVEIQDAFYFSAFHPEDDYSLQTIYYEMPRLSTIFIDEWIPLYLFEDLNFIENNNHPLRLRNLSNKLAESKVPSQYTKAGSINRETLIVETESDSTDDLQKKIIPRKLVNSSEYNLSTAMSPMFQIQDKGIILVASLIERPANLGGLIRTCEVFGVQEFIIGNIQHTQDSKFKNVSVSADKWISIQEVKPQQLREYLLTKSKCGWELVGLEQTDKSTDLWSMQFKKKTVLVLGNEKTGIPANIISILDVCVEIPQIGLIRSLNVHVSGAICLWHYAQQHIFTKNS